MERTAKAPLAIAVTVAALVAAIAIAVLAIPAWGQVATTSSADVLPSAIRVDRATGTVTLPLFKGTHDGRTVWYVVTESSNKNDAERRGVNHAPKLTNALGTRAVQKVQVTNGVVRFAGTVNFAPKRVVVPGPEGFPPARFEPGAIGDADYSPLITANGRTVLNASQVANSSGRHDAVVSIDFKKRQVTLDTLDGFYNNKPLQYLHQEGSVRLIAAIEGSTFAPNLNAAPKVGSNDEKISARSAIIPIVNGPRGVGNPQRQGLQSALLGEGDPLNITQTEPGDNDYSPVWDVTPAVWTDAAIASGQRTRLTGDGDVANLFEKGSSPAAAPGLATPLSEGSGRYPASPTARSWRSSSSIKPSDREGIYPPPGSARYFFVPS